MEGAQQALHLTPFLFKVGIALNFPSLSSHCQTIPHQKIQVMGLGIR